MDKPACKLIGTNGNVFALLGKVQQTLKDAGQHGSSEGALLV